MSPTPTPSGVRRLFHRRGRPWAQKGFNTVLADLPCVVTIGASNEQFCNRAKLLSEGHLSQGHRVSPTRKGDPGKALFPGFLDFPNRIFTLRAVFLVLKHVTGHGPVIENASHPRVPAGGHTHERPATRGEFLGKFLQEICCSSTLSRTFQARPANIYIPDDLQPRCSGASPWRPPSLSGARGHGLQCEFP